MPVAAASSPRPGALGHAQVISAGGVAHSDLVPAEATALAARARGGVLQPAAFLATARGGVERAELLERGEQRCPQLL